MEASEINQKQVHTVTEKTTATQRREMKSSEMYVEENGRVQRVREL